MSDLLARCLEIHQGITRDIVESRLLPGQPLPAVDSSEVAHGLALAMLERDGLLVRGAGGALSVRRWTRQDAEDLFGMRGVLEGLAARLCAERATDEDFDRIQEATERFKVTLDAGDIPANIRADLALHAAIARGAHSPELLRTMEQHVSLQCSMSAVGLSADRAVQRLMTPVVRTCHDALVESILAREPERAEAAARRHVEVARQRSFGASG